MVLLHGRKLRLYWHFKNRRKTSRRADAHSVARRTGPSLGRYTVTDTVAPSYLPQTSSVGGAAAELAANRKISKYSELTTSYHFVPIAFETMGPINSSWVALIKELGRRMTLITGDIKETSYLFQRLSVALQRFNAVALRGSFLQPDIVEG